MQVVTGFESDSKGEEHPLSPYLRLVDSLDRSSLELVLNSFTRIAKTALREQLPNARYVESKDARDLRPIWVCEWSVALDIPPREKRTKESVEEICGDLKDLVDNVGLSIKSTAGVKWMALIDALSPRIVQVGPQTYRFILKQKWCPNG